MQLFIQINLRLLFLLLLFTGGFQSYLYSQTKTDNVENFLSGKMRKRKIPGLQIAVIRHGKIVFLGAYGTANIQNTVSVTNQTAFSINSATKAFTGVAIMQLVEDGKVELSAPVSRYLDGLPTAWQLVTVRQLLTHVSGIPDVLIPAKGQGTGTLVGEGGEDSAWATIQTLPMEFKTGEKYRYNQTNYVLLGKIIDKLGGQPFTEFIRERQFKPVGMTNAAFGDSRDIVPRRAQAYRYSGGSLSVAPDTRLEHAFDEFTPFIRTAGGLNSTAEEVARWIISLQKGILLKESSLKMLWTNGTFNDGSPTPWALGWSTNNRLENPVAAGIGGRRSAFFVYPKDDLAIVILTNLAGANPEEFIDDVAGYYIPNLRASNGGGLPAAIKLLRLELLKRGFENAPGMVIELKKKDAKFQLTEDDLNNWGGKLMEQEQIKQAIEIFKLNVSLYPQSANTYDSLAEAYDKSGNRELAIKNYRRSLELDSRNTNAIEHLKKLVPDLK